MAKAKRKTVAKKEFSVFVIYPDQLYWDDELDMDNSIAQAARIMSDVSGMGFGERDISFTFKTRKGAENAVARIKKLHPKIKARLIEHDR